MTTTKIAVDGGDDRFTPSPSTLLVFVDETGEESLRDDGAPYFGLAGCAVRAADYDAWLRPAWGNVVNQCCSGDSSRMHASSLRPPPDRAALIGDFFDRAPIVRFAGIITRETVRDPGMTTLDAAATVFLDSIIRDVLGKYSGLFRAHLFFEACARLKSGFERRFNAAAIAPVPGGPVIPVKWHWMSKAANEPGLQVADFIAHAAGRQVLARLKHGDPKVLRQDFDSIFAFDDGRSVFLEAKGVGVMARTRA